MKRIFIAALLIVAPAFSMQQAAPSLKIDRETIVGSIPAVGIFMQRLKTASAQEAESLLQRIHELAQMHAATIRDLLPGVDGMSVQARKYEAMIAFDEMLMTITSIEDFKQKRFQLSVRPEFSEFTFDTIIN